MDSPKFDNFEEAGAYVAKCLKLAEGETPANSPAKSLNWLIVYR